MFIRRRTKAQTTAEYAILFGLVVGALLAMQLYIRRGINARIRDVVDHAGAGGAVGGEQLNFTGGQYEPYYTASHVRSDQPVMNENQEVTAGGAVARDSESTTETNRQTDIGWTGQEAE